MAEPRTIRIAGNNTSVNSYSLPPGLAQFIESVKVEVTNAAGVAVNPVLTISEQTGVVIAKQKQGSSIPAAGSGTASWFLRQGGSDSIGGGSGIQFDTDPQTGGYLHVTTTGFDPTDPNTPGIGLEATGGNDVFISADSNAAIRLDLNGGTAQYHFAHNNMSAFLDTNESTSLITGTWEADTGVANLQLKEASGLLATIPSGKVFAVRTTVDGYFNVQDNGANKGTVDVLAGKFTVQSRFPHVAFFTIDDTSGSDLLQTTLDTFTVKLKAGGKLEVQDHNGNPIFRVDEDGDLHGLTGKSLVFDL